MNYETMSPTSCLASAFFHAPPYSTPDRTALFPSWQHLNANSSSCVFYSSHILVVFDPEPAHALVFMEYGSVGRPQW